MSWPSCFESFISTPSLPLPNTEGEGLHWALRNLSVFLKLSSSELDTALQMWHHQDRVEGEDHVPQSDGHALFNVPQNNSPSFCKNNVQ